MNRLLATPFSEREALVFGQIAERFSRLFELDLVSPDSDHVDLSAYAGQLTLGPVTNCQLPSYQLPADLEVDRLSAQELIELTLDLSDFVSQISQPRPYLDKLPLHLAITDAKDQLVYHNGKPKDPFLFDEIDQAPVEDWIVQTVQESPDHAVHLLLPSLSFEQILIQSYQGLYDEAGFAGIVQQVQDIKPLLASYLTETGQAIVGWSDTTSGASISSQDYEDLF